ncbi:MAG: RNA signal recognition particle [Novosphingobium sp. 12-64-8]|nr:MAG: RNA signal recognition particle [Novosphingobium sp. 12-64-8]
MSYIDGYVIAVPLANKDKFLAAAKHFDQMLIDAGALRVMECWGDDLKHGKQTDFFRAVEATDEETVAFSWVEWPDKETRDDAHAKMEAAMAAGEFDMGDEPMPFDGKRMIFGGFAPILELGGE